MNLEKAKEYLNSYKAMLLKIGRYNSMKKINPEKGEIYDEKIKECAKTRDKIEAAIENTDGGILSEILAQKYICGRSLEEIALIVGYCKRQTERLHIKALEKIKIV